MKIALGLEYNGSRYCGWQIQKNKNTIQDKVQYAISKIANQKIKVFCAGRTDAGVHSTGQVIHFETNKIRNEKSWTIGVNNYLPKDITIKWIREVKNNFHARFSALSRRYFYIIYNNIYRPSLIYKNVTHIKHSLNINNMYKSGQLLLGEKNFNSFRSSKCQSKTPWRNVIHFNIIKFYYPYIIFDIKANSFLHHMVRNIMGSIIEIGKGKYPIKWISEILKSKNKKISFIKAKSKGLYLSEIEYPKKFNLPKFKVNSLFNF
ncbi:tRNA pseudouridine synthase A [Candidatus Annandia adelgestsuga]|uniref:tRNA pseudouridine synthase A n=1 Tax=Candidatus Annandia adelgestsuga TaxID=1302411 RepID=A0A3S5HNX4_9ENTR|nr:tRNA pseudouridine(38-40) synthase TruA [Candidatus Annandia adelgestsuga]AZP36316.1 tRNA pseudouridine synthase A [Candidatus Annandia adelgestsuga]